MNTVVWKNKTIEREKLLRLFREKVRDMPKIPEIPDQNNNIGIVRYDYEWQEYCIELRELEVALAEAGVVI